MKNLKLQDSVTILRLSESENVQLPLIDQARKSLDAGQQILIDLQGVNLNSMMVGELINLRKHYTGGLENDTEPVGLINVTPITRKLLSTVGLDKIFRDMGSLPL